MTPEEWQKVRPILESALELDCANRPAFLNEACTDPSLRLEIESLIDAHEQADTRVLNSLPVSGSGIAIEGTDDAMIGRHLGVYELERRIGQGGMAAVFLAYRADGEFHRQVAIKLVLPGLDSQDVLNRFRNERQTLAGLEHPNIVRLLDGGSTPEGLPFLVMEYVEGSPIDEYCDRHKLTVDERLRLFGEVCDAVQFAHEKLVIHRDLKPTNILVMADGTPKLLDFGIAKVLNPERSTQGWLATQTGLRCLTPAYASPEQTQGKSVSSQTDVYSLGVVLYELLTGHRPYRLTLNSPAEIERAICEQEPETPSTAINRVETDTSPDGETITKTPEMVSLTREGQPEKLRRRLRGDLDNIVLKALQKEPEHRYGSVAEFSQDIDRHLQHQPIKARPSTFAYRVSKFVQRHKTEVSAAFAVVLVTFAAAGGGWLWNSRRGSVLTEKDTIVLGDFMNSTGDPVFDDTLKQGLRVQLEQSPFLNILSDQKVNDLLQMMGRTKDDHLPPQVAREVCQRANSKVVVTGSIAGLGSHYVIALNALNCQTGDALASEQVEADNRERVLKALSESATGVRKKLGESLASIQKYDVPLEQATTPSLEALKAYSLAIKTWGANGEVDSLPFFHRAIELDPDFALAHANLGDAYENLGEPDLAAEYASKAFQLRERATERERLEISIVYYFQKTGDLLKGIQTAELWRQSYPHSSLPYHYASVAYEFLGQYEKAATYGLEALRFDPEGRNLYSNLMEDYLALNRSEEAKTVYQKALERKLDTAFLHDDRYVLAFFEGDNAEMSRQVALVAGKEGAEDMLLSAESDTEAFFGHSQKARQLARKAIESATKTNQKETAALWELDNALQEAEFGNSPEARREVQSGLARASTRDVQILAALALARAGDTARSLAISERLEKLLPYNTELNGYWLPSIRAAIQIHRGNPAQAIKLLEVAKPYDLAFPRPQVGGGGLLYPAWLRGTALLLLNRGDEATLEFQGILDHRGIILNEPIGALAHLQLGRAYVLQGDLVKARIAYQDFLTLWRDADPDIPVLQQAKAEYARLN